MIKFLQKGDYYLSLLTVGCCFFYAWSLHVDIAGNLGHETPSAVTRGNLKSDRDAEVYRDLYEHSRKMAKISLRLKENKNVQLNHNRLLYYGANYA